MDNLDVQTRANELMQMKDTDGWKLVESYIEDRMKATHAQLLTCRLDEMEKHQVAYRALNSVLIYIENEIKNGLEQF